MNLAYFTTEYPHASHTFIRREILGLEARGYSIKRIALRPGPAILESVDQTERENCHYIVSKSFWRTLAEVAGGLLVTGLALRAIPAVLRLSRNSERGLLRHFAYLLEAAALISVCRKHRVDHVHVHFGTNVAAIAYLANRLTGLSYSMTVHGPDEFDAPIGFSLGAKIEKSAFTVAISHFGASQLRRWVDYPHWEKIRVVRCTVDEHWFADAVPVVEAAESVVCIGRLSGQKGQLLLIDALRQAVDLGFTGTLKLIGDGEMRQLVEDHVRRNRLEDTVSLLGWQTAEQIREHLLASRALVMSSFAEGLPVVIMEALALQRPVLSTTIMGVPELVEDGVNGWLVPAGDTTAFAKALLRVQETPVDTLRAMGRVGQQRVREQHSVKGAVADLEWCFREYVAGADAAREAAPAT